MKLNSMPKELFAEVLDYIAEYEHLSGLNEILDGEHTILEARSAFREMANLLRKEIEMEKEQKNVTDLRKDPNFTADVKSLLSILSPGDERKLLSKFGLLDN